MRLNDDFITHITEDEHVMVATGESSRKFNGLVRSNVTAAYIIELLKEETTENDIVDALFLRYDAPRSVIEKDTAQILEKLRKIGALKEC